MSERKKKRQKYGFIFCVIVFAIALLSLCYSMFISHFGTETLGEVTQIEKKNSRNNYREFPLFMGDSTISVSYRVDGKSYSIKFDDKGEAYHTGMQISLKYLPSSPKRAMVRQNTWPAVFCLVISIICGGLHIIQEIKRKKDGEEKSPDQSS